MGVTSFLVLRGTTLIQTLGIQRQPCCVSAVDMESLLVACLLLADTKIHALHTDLPTEGKSIGNNVHLEERQERKCA